jgi:digeranylgeranylglycerophospholipid reductase
MAQLPGIGPLIRKCTLNELRGAVFVSPGGRTFEIRGRAGSAIVIDRKFFDRGLGEAAAREGAHIRLRACVDSLADGGVRVGQRVHHSRVVVGATGSRFSVASQLRLGGGNLIPGVQYEVGKLSIDEEMARVYVGGKYSQGLFGWVIPLDSSTARVGVCSRTGARRRLDGLLERVFRDFGRGKVMEVSAGAVVYGVRPRTVIGNTILLGDEALQTKPTTGGGLHYSMICAEIAARCVSRHLEDGEDLGSYEAEWRKRLGPEIRFGLSARAILDGLTDDEIDRLFDSISQDTVDVLSRAEFDRHSSVSRAALTSLPTLVGQLGIRRSLMLARLLFETLLPVRLPLSDRRVEDHKYL